jgi:transposase InsO family protein
MRYSRIDIKGNKVIVPAHVSEANGGKRKASLVTLTFPHQPSTNHIENDSIPCHLSLPTQALRLSTRCLLDNGALGDNANCISLQMAAKLLEAGGTQLQISTQVASAFTNVLTHSRGTITLCVILTSEVDHKEFSFQIDALIIDTPFSLILGREVIKRYDLVTHFPSQFVSEPATSVRQLLGPCEVQVEDVSLSASDSKCIPNSVILTAMKLRDLTVDDDTDWYAPAFESFDALLDPPPVDDDPISKIHIETDDELKLEDIMALLYEFRDIFSETLPPTPALIPPLELKIDTTKWETPKHHGPPRPQTASNQQEIRRQLDILIASNIIRPSTAPYYSQVHLADKPPKGSGKKRFCIDFVELNHCTLASEQWPLPNIKQLLQRVGKHKPKYFAKFDLTSGYHQAPMSMAAIGFTAFICFAGIFEYLRVPFGLKGAPSYFQRVIASVVLAGLIYTICENYLDDILTWAGNPQEFLLRLRLIFERFRKHNITVHPGKTFIGIKCVEMTGHMLDTHGLSFSREKIGALLNFPPPNTKTKLKSFLGLANYFRDHIRDHSHIVAPLQRYLDGYNKRQAHNEIQWDEEGKAAFELIRARIEACPKLYFDDDHSPIHLYTDACKYGGGGYLCQIITTDGRSHEVPIMFVSFSFTPTQCRDWDIPRKEAFTLYIVIVKLEYLLRGRHFFAHTDHENIVYLNTSPLSQIRKYKVYISEHDVTFLFEEGKNNVVADPFSRLVEDLTPPETWPDGIVLATLAPNYKIPHDIKNMLLKVHNDVAGHHGVLRTLAKLKRHCDATKTPYWPNMREHVAHFVKQCPCCQKMSFLKTPIAAHPFTTSSYLPMERLMMDYIGPFPDGAYILVIICCFTRWTELSSVESATAVNTAQKLLEFIGRFGAPLHIVSDRGSHFVNETIRELLALVGSNHCLNIAYSKEEAGIIERQNREINRDLRNWFFHNQVIEHYRKAIPIAQRILNTSTSTSTRVAPYQLLFGNAISLDRGIFLPHTAQTANIQPLSEYTADMLQLQHTLQQIAEASLRAKDEAHYASFPAARTEFPIGSYVLLDYPDAPPTRLHPRKRGPFRVVRFNKNDYTLEDLVSHKELTVNITRLTPFEFDPEHTDPLKVAMVDHEEFFIERILAHRGNLNRKGTLEFLVRWRGYDPSSDSWEPWKNLRDTEQLHSYLEAKGLERLIPQKFQTNRRSQH